MIERGTIWWVNLAVPRGAEPGYRRPVVIVQSDAFNRSRIDTVLAVTLTSNLRRLDAPGNVLVPARLSGLPRDSVANVSQVVTVNKADLGEPAGRLDAAVTSRLNAGLRLVLNI